MRLQAPAHRIAVVLVERALGLEVTVDDVVSLGSLAFTSRRGRLTPDDRAETMALLRKHSRRQHAQRGGGERQPGDPHREAAPSCRA